MPFYTYKCNHCDSDFELFFSIKDYDKSPKCPSCNSVDTDRQYILDVSTISSCVKKSDTELKTIGDLANRNRDRMSDDQKTELYQRHNAYKQTESEKQLPAGMSRIKKKGKKNNWRNL